MDPNNSVIKRLWFITTAPDNALFFFVCLFSAKNKYGDHIYHKYWDNLTSYHTCPNAITCPFYWVFSLLRPVCPNIEIIHGFSWINIRQVPWEVLKTEAKGRGFQHLPRYLANVNTLKNHVRSLLLHKKWKHLLHLVLFLALFCFAFSPMSRERNFRRLCSF